MASNSLRRLRSAKLAWDDWGLGNARSVLFAALLGLSLVPVWIVRYPPLQDYPDWLLQAQILRRLHDPAFGFADHYAVLAAPVPNSGSVALIYLFSFLAPIEVAGKLALSVYLLALPLSALYFLRDLPQPRRVFREAGYGSHMIWASPEVPVFIDPRIEPYLLAQWDDYFALSRARHV